MRISPDTQRQIDEAEARGAGPSSLDLRPDTVTLEPYTAIQCKTCQKWIDESRISYPGSVADHYAEEHPAIVAKAIEDGTADDAARWSTGPNEE